MNSMKRWISFLLLILALNFAWEMLQADWFASMHGLPLLRATLLCLRASLGDLVITAVAFAIAALVRRSPTWPAERGIIVPAAIFLTVAIAIAVVCEAFALSASRWQYDASMPTLFGIGLLPLLQWLVLPIVDLWTFRLIFRRAS
jgi:hypothetical protein